MIFAIIIISILRYQNHKKRHYERRFMELIKQQNLNEEKEYHLSVTKNNGIEIPENIIENVLEKLSDFENAKQYLKKNITVASLSKELKNQL